MMHEITLAECVDNGNSILRFSAVSLRARKMTYNRLSLASVGKSTTSKNKGL